MISGTSRDGVDAALVALDTTTADTVSTHSRPIPDLLRQRLITACDPAESASIDELGALDALLDAVRLGAEQAPGGREGGAITAALFLESFVDNDIPWVHIDTFAWNQTDRPGRLRLRLPFYSYPEKLKAGMVMGQIYPAPRHIFL